MDEQTARNLLNQLASGDIKECNIKKEDFLTFRSQLVARPDFKHFRGVAQHSGDIIYYYLEKPRA